MGGGESEKEEDWPASSIAGARLVDSPILFFVASHKAFRAELALLRRVAAEAAESGDTGRELVVDLSQRLEFLKLVWDYHAAAEDEVIFLALDSQVKNVVPTYSLEHKSIEDNFSTIFHHLDLLMKEDGDAPQMFQEFLFSIGTVQTMICQHMQKEEEQVFTLLMQKFTSEEQSQLVWRYMCSVPFILLQECFPWMTRHLTKYEKQDLLDCINLIMPRERLLQEVVVSWIQHEEISSSDAENTYGKGYRFLSGLSSSEGVDKLYPPQIHFGREQQLKKAFSVETRDVDGPFKGILLWHTALQKDFEQIIAELYHIRTSNCFSSLSSVIVQLKFMADVVIFYSNTLDKILYPLLNLLAKNSVFPFSPLIDGCQIKCLQSLLFLESQSSAQLRSFVEMLCQDLESLVRGLDKSLMFLEAEIFPSIIESCTSEIQLWLLYTSFHMMPLGLLRCTITWFCAHLTDSQSKSILKNMKLGCPAIDTSFTSLLHEWVRIGCSGKTSIEKFRQSLEEMFNGKSFYLADQNRQQTLFSGQLLKQNSAIETKKSVGMPSSSVSTTTKEHDAMPSSSVSMRSEEHDVSYPNSMNLHLFFSQLFKTMPSFRKNLAEPNHATVPTLESRPMDVVFYIHRALMKDLEYLVTLSAKLAANVGFLAKFKKCFELLQNIFEIHSNSEDEIVFPALESKGALKNISHSYCIDHKLEAKYFTKTSKILNEISELHEHEESNFTRLKHHQFCLKLHDTCLSMHKVLSDHMHREEVEIFPLFRECFSIEEEEKIVGHMLGRTRAEILQEMIPWVMAHLSSDEQHALMSLWLKVARNTKFDEWLQEWWEGMARYNISMAKEGSRPPSLTADPLEVVSTYLLKDQSQRVCDDAGTQKEFSDGDFRHCGFFDVDKSDESQSQDLSQCQSEVDKKSSNEVNDRCHDEAELHERKSWTLRCEEHPLSMNQEELEAAIRRVSRDSNLDIQKKSYIIQNLLMSRWIITQKMFHEASVANHKGEVPGQSPSYQDPLKLKLGCKHYTRNCKLLASCCNKLYTCIRCHDDLTDHSVDRKTITKMMCMKCLVIQQIGPRCTSQSCSGFSMARYYCRICKLFDDERQIYHCPYCNLCRVGKGLGIDYFHCMKCNACMSRSLFVHVCREKCLEDNCPICHEYIFTSNSPVKALPCGHLMHSSCFQVYTCSHYVCPICSKSLGDMQVYFGMLDALLAEEKLPEEYSGQIQAILCNDCEKRGTASFHWLYHKCPYCGSYNTRLL